VPRYAPSFAELTLPAGGGDLRLSAACALRDASGRPLTGLPNLRGRDPAPRSAECQGVGAARQSGFSGDGYDAYGLDVEDAAPLPGGRNCLGVEEYAPSLFVFNCDFDDKAACGTVLARCVAAAAASACTTETLTPALPSSPPPPLQVRAHGPGGRLRQCDCRQRREIPYKAAPAAAVQPPAHEPGL
jgi:hypothetical protein